MTLMSNTLLLRHILIITLFFASAHAWMQEPFLTPASSCSPFNPRSYEKSVARCAAINRATNVPVDIELSYVDINPTAERTLLLVHGWPAIWSTWSNQIQHFEKDFHLIVPDLRGFGASTHPDDVESSGTMSDMVADLACILSHANVSNKVVCVGHDWGAQVCWQAARMRPDLIGAVSGVVLPYLASVGPFVSNEQLAKILPALAYQVFFEQETKKAVQELDSDIRRTIRGTYRSASSPPPSDFLKSNKTFMGAWDETDEIAPIPFMSPVEEDYLVEQMSIQGFKNTIQFYTHSNRYFNWEFDHSQGNFTIPQPAIHIYPTNDPVANWGVVAKLVHASVFVPQLTSVSMEGQHWPQLEDPVTFNSILRSWLEVLPAF